MKFPRFIATLLVLIMALSLIACEGGQTTNKESVKITDNGTCEYYVIRSEYSSDLVKSLCIELRNAFASATGVKPGISTDWHKSPVYEREIIIDRTLREENLDFTIDRTSLGHAGYIVKEHNGKIYLCGGSEVGTILAVQYFISEFIKDGQDVSVPIGYEHIVIAD